MKICNTCQKENDSRRLNLCHSCYHKEWWIKNRPLPKIKQRSLFCLDCSKERERHGRSVKYCNSCALKRSYAKRPEALERRKIQSRNYNRLKRGTPIDLPLMRALNGTGHLDKKGYVIICRMGHLNAKNDRGRMFEHTFVMSQHLGRALRHGETVHHINGIRNDNRIENLELWSSSHPPGQRVSDKIQWAKEFLEVYGYIITEPK
jgi:hypothetical protein